MILVYGVLSPFVVVRDFRWMYFLLAVLLVVATLMFVTFVPAAPELPGDGAASSSAAAGTEEGANSSAKKDVSILDAWKNRNSLVLGLCLLLNNLVGVGLLTWLATMYSQQFWITPAGWQYMVVMLGYGLSLWIATSTGPGVVKKWFENNEKVFMLIMSVIGAELMIVAVIIPNLWGSAFAALNIGAFLGGMTQGALIGAVVDAGGTRPRSWYWVHCSCSVVSLRSCSGNPAPRSIRRVRARRGPMQTPRYPRANPTRAWTRPRAPRADPTPGGEPRREGARQATVAAARPLAVVTCSVSR